MKKADLERQRKHMTLHLLDSHLIGIGTIAVRAAMLDSYIEGTVEAGTRHLSPILRKAALDLSLPQKVNLIKQWREADLPNDKKEVQELFSKVHATRSERDDVIHRAWKKTDIADIKELVDLRNWIPNPKSPRKVSSEYLLNLADRITDLVLEMGDMNMRAFRARSPEFFRLPTIPRQQASPASSEDSTAAKEASAYKSYRRLRRPSRS